jgi:hypothetical protein
MRTFSELKDKQRRLRDGFSEPFGLRVHRSISWIGRAEEEAARRDPDAQFIFLWIAFNAAYAGELNERETPSERDAFRLYFQTLASADAQRVIYNALWWKFSGSVRLLLDNRYIFGPFWREAVSGGVSGGWRDAFEVSNRLAREALSTSDVGALLEIVFDRLYVLRNQIVHGASTWSGSVNRSQIVDGAAVLAFLTPVFVDLMMDNPTLDWGRPFYPVVS